MQDKIMAEGKWEFDKKVADCFDDMLSRSIPNYTTMRQLTFDIARQFVKENSRVLDIGCSNGKSIEQLAGHCNVLNDYGYNTHILGVDISEPFVQESKRRFEPYTGVTIAHRDIIRDFPCGEYDVIQSILTAQFTPLECRHELLQTIYESLNKGGAFIFVEKLLCNDASINEMFVDLYYDIKRKNGYTEEQIQAKRESLKGVLVPLTDEWNRSLLASVGFRKVECFWRCYNFAGYLCVKE